MFPKRPTTSIYRRCLMTLIGIVVISTTLGLLVLWVQGLPGPSHGFYLTYASLVNIRSLLETYEDECGHLPQATIKDEDCGQLSSWRIEVLQSFVRAGTTMSAHTSGNLSISYDYKKPWNDSDNLRLEVAGVHFFEYQPEDGSNANDYSTYFKAVTGLGTAFDGVTVHSLNHLPNDLIVVVRVEYSNTHWMQPGDLSIEELVPSKSARQLLSGKNGYAVLFADGEPWILSDRLPISDLSKFFTVAGALQFDRA